MTTRWTRKDLLGLRELSADELNFVLDTADEHAHPDFIRVGGVSVERGRDQYLGNEFEPDERRDA